MRAVSARFESVFRDVIDKVVDVQAVARGINAFDARHIILIADGAFRTAVNIDVQAFGKFVFGDKSDGQDKRVALDNFFRTLNRLHFSSTFATSTAVSLSSPKTRVTVCDKCKGISKSIRH